MVLRAAADSVRRFTAGLSRVVFAEASPSRAEIACARRCSCWSEVSIESMSISMKEVDYSAALQPRVLVATPPWNTNVMNVVRSLKEVYATGTQAAVQ